MKNTFDTIIDSFIKDKVGIADDFLSKSLAASLKANLQRLYEANQLQSAGTGHRKDLTVNRKVRGDEIYWLDRNHEDVYENLFFDQMDAFVTYLNETCYTGINSYEFHYTRYEIGTFYKKHMDQFRNNDSRKFSMIIYLNEDWVEQDGGELCIHHLNSLQLISPNSGKSVFFQSNELEHEVLVTHKSRISITGWLKI
jgi:SM-20-related protein